MPTEMEKYRVKANLLNFRQGSSIRDAVIGHLRKNDVIEKISESEDGNWIKTTIGGAEGWVSKKYLAKLPYLPGPNEDFLWMAIAEKEKGVKEVPGVGVNPRVLEYLQAATDLSRLAESRDETPWCSAFVNWCLKQAGYAGTNSAAARSWLDWGRAIEVPRRGCIVVFSRGPRFGHVGFYLSETETDIIVLGGNQDNPQTRISEVNERPYSKSRLLGYRIPG